MYSNDCSLSRHVNSLCYSRIAAAKFSVWSCVDARWRSSICRVFSQTFLKSIVWWHSYLPSFPVSWPPRSPAFTPMYFWLWRYVESKVCHFSSINCIWFETCHQNCDSRYSYCHGTYCNTIHHLPHAKCHRVWRRSCGRFVKHNKILHLMLLLCPSWLSSLLAYLAPVIFVQQLPFERYLGLFTMEITFQYKTLGVATWNFRNFLTVTVTVWVPYPLLFSI